MNPVNVPIEDPNDDKDENDVDQNTNLEIADTNTEQEIFRLPSEPINDTDQ